MGTSSSTSAAQAVRLGPFDLHLVVGRGAMGEVWRGVHRATETPVAVKVLTVERARRARYRVAFKHEVRAVSGLDHPGIVRVHDYGEVDAHAASQAPARLIEGSPYLVMELASGGTLSEVGLVTSWPRLRGMLVALLDALAHAHARGVIHRDLKTSNVLVRGAGQHELALSDFGIAHATHEAYREAPARAVGTPDYMAPEQVLGRVRDTGPWTDLYALGCLGWRLATGRAPYSGQGRSVDELMRAHLTEKLPPFQCPWLPRGFQRWLTRLLAKLPSDRFSFAADARRALDALGAEPPSVYVPSTWRAARDEGTETRRHLMGVGLGIYAMRQVPFVNRDAERDALWALLGEVERERTPRLAVVRGAAGVGKTRLAAWLSARAHELGAARTLTAGHDPQGEAGGLGPMVGRHLRCGGLEPGVVFARLRRLFPDNDVQLLAALTALVAPASEHPSGDPADEPPPMPVVKLVRVQERYALVRWVLRQTARRRPAIVWLDDVQWGLDALGFVSWLLDATGKGSRDLPVLVVVTARDEALAERPVARGVLAGLAAREDTLELRLGPLGELERASLVRRLLGLQGELAASVEQRCGGNPLFAVQLVGDWVRRGVLEPSGEGFRLREGERAELPADLEAVWSDRADRLLAERPEGVAVALEIAAVLGLRVDGVEWRRACAERGLEVSEEGLAEIVEALLSQRLASTGRGGPERWFSFVHGMLREALESRARRGDRLEGHHRACADALRADASDAATGWSKWGLYERIGMHLVAGGRPEQALAHLERGIEELLDAADTRRAAWLVGVYGGAVEAAALPPHDARHGIHLVLQARQQRVARRFEASLEAAERALARAREHGWDRVRARALQQLGGVGSHVGRAAEAEDWLAEAVEAASALADDRLLADCRGDLGRLWVHRGRREEARACLDQSRAGFETLGDAPGVALCDLGLGELSKQEGDLDAATRLLERALDGFERSGIRWGIAHAANALADTHRFAGRLQAAEDGYRRALALHEAMGTGASVLCVLNLGLVALSQRRWGRARQQLERGREMALEEGRQEVAAAALALSLPIAAAEDDARGWDAGLAAGRALTHDAGLIDADLAATAEQAGHLALERGHPERAHAAFALARHQWQALGRADRAADLPE